MLISWTLLKFFLWLVSKNIKNIFSIFYPFEITWIGLQVASKYFNHSYYFRNGAERSGLFFVAIYVAQQIKTKKRIDIFSAVKHVRLYRPQCIANMVRFSLVFVLVLCIFRGLNTSGITIWSVFFLRNSTISSMSLQRSSSSIRSEKPRRFKPKLTNFKFCLITNIKGFNSIADLNEFNICITRIRLTLTVDKGCD